MHKRFSKTNLNDPRQRVALISNSQNQLWLTLSFNRKVLKYTIGQDKKHTKF